MAHSSISGGSCAPRLCQRSHRSARRTVCLAGAAAVHHAQQHNAVFPHTGTFSFNGKDVDSQTLIDLLVCACLCGWQGCACTCKPQHPCIHNAMQAPFMTEERIQRIQRAVAQRTYNVGMPSSCWNQSEYAIVTFQGVHPPLQVVPVVEGLYDMGNLAACCRSADAFGLGAVHAVNRR
jgi:hypothetical protein